MKKMAWGISVILTAFVFLVPPAMAASVPHGAPALSAFLASLATPAPVPMAKRPALTGKALCTASANCANGGTVSCSGNNSATSCSAVDGNCNVGEPGHVTCDGVTTWCSDCACSCAAERANCAADCDPCPFTFSCSTSTCPGTCHCKFAGCPV